MHVTVINLLNPLHSQSSAASIMFLITAGGSLFTLMFLLSLNALSSSHLPDNLLAIFVVELIGLFGMIISYVRDYNSMPCIATISYLWLAMINKSNS